MRTNKRAQENSRVVSSESRFAIRDSGAPLERSSKQQRDTVQVGSFVSYATKPEEEWHAMSC